MYYMYVIKMIKNACKINPSLNILDLTHNYLPIT